MAVNLEYADYAAESEVNDQKLDQPLSEQEKAQLTEQAQAWVALTSGTYANS
jgi:hypothetical protein